MKVSASSPPEETPNFPTPNSQVGHRHSGSWRLGSWVLALIYFAAHLPFLAPSLEDYDSINFALGLRGSPVYILLGRALLAPIVAVAPALGATEAEALTLALWSALAGLVAIVAAASVFAACATPRSARAPMWAAALLASAPLFWISGLRPMSDLVGLAAELCLATSHARPIRDAGS